MSKNKNLLIAFSLFVILAIALIVIFTYQKSDENQQSSSSLEEIQEQSKGSETPKKLTHKDQKELPRKQEKTPDQSLKTRQKNLSKGLQDFREFCLEEFPQYQEIMPDNESLQEALFSNDLERAWVNHHLESSDGTIYRVRLFLDDGGNRQNERLVFYEEDETGFPEIIEIPKEHSVDPGKETLKYYLSKGETIYTNEAHTLETQNNSYLFEVENNEIIRFDVSSPKGHINCQAPR